MGQSPQVAESRAQLNTHTQEQSGLSFVLDVYLKAHNPRSCRVVVL